jgi:sugar lactone lactonase YvrE
MRTRTVLISALIVLAATLAAGQKIESVDGVKVVHNSGPGAWGKTPKVALEPVRVLGDVDTADENVAFYMPSMIAVDGAGDLLVLDTGNHRVQKFGPDGKYLATFGRQGQGPGEFYYPAWLAIDDTGFLYVTDPNNQRIEVLTADGKDHKTIKGLEQGAGPVFLGKPGELVTGGPLSSGRSMRFIMNPDEKKPETLPKLVKVLDRDGKALRAFGEPVDFKNELVNSGANETIMTVDAAGQVYLVFPVQNRIEKYAADGRLLWRADRELPYSMEIKEKGKIDRQGGGVSIRMPEMNRCASGVAVDAKGRIWVVGMTRQLRKEEQAGMAISMTMDGSGGRTIGYKPEGDGLELRTTDAYKLEVYDAEGILLGSLPLDFFVDGIFIYGDRLFLMDKLRGAQFREYKIKG